MPEATLTERFAGWATGLEAAALPPETARTARRLLLDVVGLCVAARRSDYVRAAINGWDGSGRYTLIGHRRSLDAAGCALVNGTAAHGEDYDDTFEGTPVHAGAVVVPAALAACERFGGSGSDLLKGVCVGAELMCRMALVAPTAIHRAGFHPTAVIGALGAAATAGVASKLSPAQLTQALGIAGSFASGIIEYLAEGAWTKRLHAGWAAQSGLRAARLAQAGFSGPRTVLEGRHGFFHAFTNADVEPDFAPLEQPGWLMQGIAFKPYACGTMTQPFIDCALRLRREGIVADDIAAVTCKVGEGTVHRLWEPLAEKRRPTTPYSAKFSVPFCIAVALIDGAAGLEQFSEQRVRDPAVLALAERIGYTVDPDNEYPLNYSGHLAVHSRGGQIREVRQPHLRGGVREPLSDAELLDKFRANAAFGGWSGGKIDEALAVVETLFEADDLRDLQRLR